MVGLVRRPNKSGQLGEAVVSGESFQTITKLRLLTRWTVNDAIVGLNQTAFMLATLHRWEFVRILATVTIRGVPVGIIEYTKKPVPQPDVSRLPQAISPPEGSGPVNQTNIQSGFGQQGLEPNSTSLSQLKLPPSGWATSREDPRLRIHYQFGDDVVGGGQILMTFMDALATASSHALDSAIDAPFTAIGKNSFAETHFRVEPSGAPGTSCSWGQLIQAMVVFWEQGIFTYHREGNPPRWNILDTLLIQYNGFTIAYGTMTCRRFPSVSQS
ncbi:MAG: hypothetical protein Q9218_007454 [Villophora microphyllina]